MVSRSKYFVVLVVMRVKVVGEYDLIKELSVIIILFKYFIICVKNYIREC